MKIFTVILAFICAAVCSAFPGDTAKVPIVIVVQKDSPLRPQVNGRVMALPEMVEFLSGASEKFGSEDPVVIRFEDNGHIAVAATIAEIAGKTHDSIFIEIRATDDGRIVHVLPIAKEGVQTRIDSGKAKGGPVLLPDGNPHRVIDKQLGRFRERARGEGE